MRLHAENGSRANRPDLAKTFGLLSPKRQELFRPVLENPRDYVLLNARELAHKLKAIPPRRCVWP